jgi:hypothetical protein
MTPEEARQVKHYVKEAAKLLKKDTSEAEPQDYESILH